MSPTDEGLDFETFRMFMALMGTYIIKRAKKSKIHDKKVQVGSAGLDEGEETDHTNSRVTLNLNASENDLKLPSQLPEMVFSLKMDLKSNFNISCVYFLSQNILLDRCGL